MVRDWGSSVSVRAYSNTFYVFYAYCLFVAVWGVLVVNLVAGLGTVPHFPSLLMALVLFPFNCVRHQCSYFSALMILSTLPTYTHCAS